MVDKCKHAANMFANVKYCATKWAKEKRAATANICIPCIEVSNHHTYKSTDMVHVGIKVPARKHNMCVNTLWRHKAVTRNGRLSSLCCYYFHTFAVNNVDNIVKMYHDDTLNVVLLYLYWMCVSTWARFCSSFHCSPRWLSDPIKYSATDACAENCCVQRLWPRYRIKY